MVGSFFAKKYLLQKAVTADSAVKIEGENGAYYARSVRFMCKSHNEELILRPSISRYIQIGRLFLPQILPCQLSDSSAILNIEARNNASHAAVTYLTLHAGCIRQWMFIQATTSCGRRLELYLQAQDIWLVAVCSPFVCIRLFSCRGADAHQ